MLTTSTISRFVWSPIAAAALLVAMASPALAKGDDDFDATAMKSIERLSDFTAKAKQFSVTIDAAYDIVQDWGQKLEFGETRTLTLRRPDRFKVEATDRNGAVSGVVFDGREITAFDLKDKVYATTPQPGSLDDAVTRIVDDLGMRLPMAAIFQGRLAKDVKSWAREVHYVEESTIAGVTCDHVVHPRRLGGCAALDRARRPAAAATDRDHLPPRRRETPVLGTVPQLDPESRRGGRGLCVHAGGRRDQDRLRAAPGDPGSGLRVHGRQAVTPRARRGFARHGALALVLVFAGATFAQARGGGRGGGGGGYGGGGGGFSRGGSSSYGSGAARGGSFGGSGSRGFGGGASAGGAQAYQRNGGASSGSFGSGSNAQQGQAAHSSNQDSRSGNQAARQSTSQTNQGNRQSYGQQQQDSRQEHQNNMQDDRQDAYHDAYHGGGYYGGGYHGGAYYGGGYHGGAYYGGSGNTAAAAAVGVAAGMAMGSMMTASQMQSQTNSSGCSMTNVEVNGITYAHCGSSWYQPVYKEGQLAYQVVKAPL